MSLKKRVLASTMLSAAMGVAMGGMASAQVDRIVVTATKTEQDSQSIPVAVSAIGADDLAELDVDVFADYLVQLPGVTAGGSGPGQNTIYIRGIASTTPNLTTAGVAGLAPNVAFYLDEQPLAQPGRNLDVYAVDLERVEVLPGPQGTLFGASSQAGTVRMITNKPLLGVYEAAANFGLSFTEGGEESYSTDVMVNLPVGDNFALRMVGFWDQQGGYIDNVAGTVNTSESARFRPSGTVRSNGVPVNANRGGFQAGADLSAVTFIDADNSALVEDDFNDTTYSGFRISGRYEFNPDWRLTVSAMSQQLDTDGVFFQDPELEDYDVQRYNDEFLEDDFVNASWTLEGRLAMLDVVYTGAFTDRDSEQVIDYTEYMFVGQYFPYYTCEGSVTYPGAAAPSGTCYSPESVVGSTTNTTVESHELRFNTPQDQRWRVTAGGFYSSTEVEERNDFTYFGSVDADPFGPFAPNFPFQTGFTSDDGPFPEPVIFRNDVKRTDEQLGLFGEVSYDLVPGVFAVTAGARYYDIEVDLAGSANASFCNSGGTDANAFGTDISDLYNGDGQYTFRGTCDTSRHITYNDTQSIADILAIDPALSQAQAQQIFNAARAPDVAASEGSIFKLTGTWTPAAGMLFYATYSEGFRPGLLNRPGGAPGPNGYTVPFAIDSDELTNYELGWKLDLFEDQVRFNGSAFFVEIEDLQTTIFDPSIVNLFFSDNAANAEILGLEGDVTWAPADVPGLTVSSAFSILDSEITEVLVPTNDVVVGEELAYAPNLQLNARARYEWQLENTWTAHVQGQVIYSSDSRSDIIEINAAEVEGYATLGLRTGLTSENWSAELFVDNVTNENAELANNYINDRERVTPMRPRTYGIRFGISY
ncbi:MAG TPA: TonB-dependent receptor [Oceanicaulis sp.]|nr:TonB-dependent receptor [Oceanicaulis sp.]|tara:strand:+ start:6374 stop:8992 length:2619 start_codon:yes stop_codon:yes gene_type:complete